MRSTKLCSGRAAQGILALTLTACGGGEGGGGSGVDVGVANSGSLAVVCEGAFTNSATGQVFQFPCQPDGLGACLPVTPSNLNCGVADDAGTPVLIPDLISIDQLPESWCACKIEGITEENQAGSCQNVCDEMLQNSPVFAGDPNWSCVANEGGNATKVLACEHGSVVYLNGGPSDYGIQLVGTQRTTARFSVLGSDVTRTDTSDVDGWMRLSIEGRENGCAAGCPIEANEFTLIIRPFELDGYEILGVGWDGLEMDDISIVNQGTMTGVIYDNGDFQLNPANAKLLVEARGDVNEDYIATSTRIINGHLNFTTNAVTWDSLTLDFGDHDIRVGPMNGAAVLAPPVPVISTASFQECVSIYGTPVTLDASTSIDPREGALTHQWIVDGVGAGNAETFDVDLTLGTHEVRLKSTNFALSRGYTSKTIEVVDTTPPLWGDVALADFASCDVQVDTQTLVAPPVTDGCTGVEEVEAWLVELNGTPTSVELDLEAALLPAGQGVIEWIARDFVGNESRTLQTFRVGPAIVAEERIEMRDRSHVYNQAGQLGAVGALGQSESQFGVQSKVAEVLTFGPQFYQNYAQVTQKAQSGSSITEQDGADVQGKLEGTPPNIASIPWLAEVDGTVFPSTEFNLWSGQTQVLPTDTYGVIRVYSGSRLIVPFAAVNVRELWLEPDAIVEFQAPNPRLVIGDRWINRGSLVSTTAGSQIDIRVLGSEVILERPVTGVALMAPNAKVTVTTMANNSHFGILVGDVVEIQPDVRLWCDRSTSLSTSD